MKNEKRFANSLHSLSLQALLFVLGLIFTLNTSRALAQTAQNPSADSTLASFIKLMTTPTLTPPTLELLNKFMLFELNNTWPEKLEPIRKEFMAEDQELKTKVLDASKEILNNVLKCLPDHTEPHRQLKSKLQVISNDLPNVRVYALTKNSQFGISTQYRFGAINLPNKSILFNLKYPSWDEKLNKPYYFHEVLEALSYEDRYYQLTGTLWALYQNCNFLENIKTSSAKVQASNMIKSIQQSSSHIIQSESVISKINSLIDTPLNYNKKLISKNDEKYDSMIADGGGTTGVGSGGDPTAAYFMASLYDKTLRSIDDLKSWDKIINTRVEAFPGAAFFWNCLKKYDIESELCQNSNVRENLESNERITNHLLNTHQAIKDQSKDSYSYFHKHFYLFFYSNKKIKGVNGNLIVLDAQLLHWYYSNFKIQQENFLPENFILDEVIKQ